MHIHKPDDVLLMLGHACRAGQPVLTVTVGYVCGPDGGRVSEQDAWQGLMPLFPDEPFDLGEKKAGGGFGVAGDACAPAGTQVEGLTVRAGVGELEARVLVQGDRRWNRTAVGWQATRAEPFERMSIGLARAYGGPDWRDNPYGRGHVPHDVYEGVPLPNIEVPSQPVLKPTDTPATATLGPQPMGSAGRNRWLGSADDMWVRTRLPWLPDDTDPRWFDRFAPQQCQAMYWRGDEPWFAENMHPQHGVLQGRLPGLRPRLLLRTVADPDRHVELGLDLDTVWLMPNDRRVAVLYRAQTAVKREDAKDIRGLAVFTERLSEPAQPLGHWSGVWRKAVDDSEARVAAAVPVPLSPEAMAQVEAARSEAQAQADAFQASLRQDIDEALSSGTAEMEDHLRDQGFDVEALKAQGAQADDFGFSRTQPWDTPGLPGDAEGYRAALEAHIDGALKAEEAQARAYLEQQGFDVDALLAHAKANSTSESDLATVVEESLASLGIPESERQAYLETFQNFQKEIEELETGLPARFEEAGQASAAMLATLETGRFADPAELPTGPRARLTRDMLLERAGRGESATWTELEGLDLAGVSLAGIDLRGSVLRECDLRGAVLQGADLTETLFDNCQLGEADLSGARLLRAQLESCTLRGARLGKADFSEARIDQCVFDQAGLDATCWNDALVSESGFEAALFTGAAGQRARFTQCRLAGADATESRFEQTEFAQCLLDGARFSRARLAGSTLLACQAAHAQLDHAALPGLRTLLDTRLDQANLSGADLQDASLQNTSLAQAVLREARLDRALVKECDLTGTDAWRMVAREADFTDSHIAQASWRGANLMQATLGYTRLFDTDLTGANFHAAQTRTATVQGLTLDGALMTRCRILEEYGHG